MVPEPGNDEVEAFLGHGVATRQDACREVNHTWDRLPGRQRVGHPGGLVGPAATTPRLGQPRATIRSIVRAGGSWSGSTTITQLPGQRRSAALFPWVVLQLAAPFDDQPLGSPRGPPPSRRPAALPLPDSESFAENVNFFVPLTVCSGRPADRYRR